MAAYEIHYTYALKAYTSTVWARSAEQAQADFGGASGETVVRVVTL